LGQFPNQRVFATTAADDKYFHNRGGAIMARSCAMNLAKASRPKVSKRDDSNPGDGICTPGSDDQSEL
jgi:hypothetical protein